MSGPFGSSQWAYSSGAGAAATGQSLKFDDNSSSFLEAALSSSPTDTQKRTFSWWMKLNNIGIDRTIASTYLNGQDTITLNSSNKVYISATDGGAYYESDAVFRDTTAWYHFVYVLDTTESTSTDRMKLYINGVLETATSQYLAPTLNSTADTFAKTRLEIGRNDYSSNKYGDYYLAEVVFLDGQALDATSFGEYDSTYPQFWKPKSSTDIKALTFGTNGFYLPFSQTAEAEGFSTVTYSGSGADHGIKGVGFEPDFVWIKNRTYGTANTSYSHTLFDSVRGVGRYLNSNETSAETVSGSNSLTSFDDNGFSISDGGTLTNASGSNYVAWAWDAGDNLPPTGFSAVTYTGNGDTQSISGLGFQPDLVWVKKRSGIENHELTDSVRGAKKRLQPNVTNAEDTGGVTSFDSNGFTLSGGYGTDNENGYNYVAWCWDAGSGSAVSNTDGSITSTVKANTAKGFSIGTLTKGSGTETFGHGLSSAPELLILKRHDSTGSWFSYSSVTGATKWIRLNGTDAATTDSTFWNDTAPTSSVATISTAFNSGEQLVFYAWHSVAGYSSIGSYTGTGATGNSITGLGFRPAFVMIKRTDNSGHWNIYDSTRDTFNPTNKILLATSSNAEASGSAYDINFDSDGFTINNTDTDRNASGSTYLYMAFAGGQDLVSPLNTDGSITSRVKANTAKGFSIVSYTSNASGQDTVGHGLTSAPEMIITKSRDGSTFNWSVFHASVCDTTSKYLKLNASDALSTYSTVWGAALPTSSVFGITSGGAVEASDACIAYCFHSVSGYSSIGTYTGNGTTSNSVTGLGFKPAFLMIKNASISSSWYIFDNTRNVDGDADLYLRPNLTNAEATLAFCTFTSDGFDITSSAAEWNGSGNTITYMAFADTRDATFWGDQSGNGNNFTQNNLNNTDVVLDSPVTNWCTMNTLDNKGSVVVYNGNLTVSAPLNGNIAATIAPGSGKWYWEVYINDSTNPYIGVRNVGTSGASGYTQDSVGLNNTGNVYYDASFQSINASTGFAVGDVVGVAYDADNNKIWWSRNGQWYAGDQASATEINISAVENGTDYYDLSSQVPDGNGVPYFGSSASNGIGTFNFGQDDTFDGVVSPKGWSDANSVGLFHSPVPSGFLALATTSFADPAVADPKAYFEPIIWSKTGADNSTISLTSLSFQPDLVWAKGRSNAMSHQWTDSVRGATKSLSSDSTGTEDTNNTSGYVSSFDSNGFTAVSGTSDNFYYNYLNGYTYVAWNWKSGGAANTFNIDGVGYASASAAGLDGGDITPTGATVNTTSGFSIITFTGTGATSATPLTINHGLGVKPGWIILKDRDANSNNNQWIVGHKGLDTNGYTYLSDTSPGYTSTSGTVAVSNADATNFALGVASSPASNTVNESGDRFVAWIFAEVPGYSKFGLYTGNGNADGVYVPCGFRPALVIMKSKSQSGGGWYIADTTRSPENEVDTDLYAQDAAAEPASGGGSFIDITASGFKHRSSRLYLNSSGSTYLFCAFAESPFKFSNAR